MGIITEGKGPKQSASVAELELALTQVYTTVTKLATKCAQANRENAKANVKKANSDAASGYKRLFRQLKANQAPPCSLLKITGVLTGDMGKIHQEFATKWEVICKRLRN